MERFSAWMQANRWIWSAIATLVLWGVLSVVTNRFSVESLSGIVLSASFLTIVGIGQMFVVTTGRGNIDLSIASVITLNAYVALLTIHGLDANVPLGLVVALGLGLVIGGANAALVVLLRIPAIIATLATGYVLATATLLANRSIPGFAVSPLLKAIAGGRLAGVPVMGLVALVCVVAAAFVLRFTVYGQTLSAVGQSRAAARLAVRHARVRDVRRARLRRTPARDRRPTALREHRDRELGRRRRRHAFRRPRNRPSIRRPRGRHRQAPGSLSP